MSCATVSAIQRLWPVDHAQLHWGAPMTDSYPQLAALVLLGVIASLMTGAQLVSIARDTDTWLIVRDTARGRLDRIRRRVKPRRG